MANKTLKVRAAVNDIACGLTLPKVAKGDKPERCHGVGFVPVTLRLLAWIRTGHDYVKDNVKFSCNHVHDIRLVR